MKPASLLRFFFSLLYGPCAWAYDTVAWIVSLGRWQDWARTALLHVQGRTLELGCGPGHLLTEMQQRHWGAFGLDASRQMIALAARRLKRAGLPPRLVRARAQALPYPASAFDTVVATFPAEFIFEHETLQEIRRVLTWRGRAVIVAMVWFTGRQFVHRALGWLFRQTGESQELERFWPRVAARLETEGFAGRFELVEMDAGRVLVILAEKKQAAGQEAGTTSTIKR